MNLLPLSSFSSFGSTIQDNITIYIDLDKNGVGKPTNFVSKAIRHICGIWLPQDNFSREGNILEAAKEYYNEIENQDKSGQQLLVFLSYVSGFFHELRHAHDLLATTYGQEVLFLTLNCYQNTPSLLSFISEWQQKNPDRSIPIPLSININEFEGVSLFNEMNKLLDYYNSKVNEIASFNNPKLISPAGLSTTHLLEGSAFEIQMDIVRTFFGEKAAHRLFLLINNNDNGNIYLLIRRELSDAFIAKGYTSYDISEIICYLIWCSLMGSTFEGAKLSEGPTSVAIYEGLAEFVLRNADKLDSIGIRNIVAEFYESWNLLPLEKVANYAMKNNELRIKSGEHKLNELGVESDKRPFLVAYKYFTNSYKGMYSWINSSNLLYFTGRGYFFSYLDGQLPSLHYKLKLNNKVSDFMSRGYDAIPFDSWGFVSFMSTVFKILVNGRCSTSPLFFENMCFNQLTSQEWDNTKLRFFDTTFK